MEEKFLMENNLKKFKFTIVGLGLILIGLLATEIVNIYKMYSVNLWVNWLVFLPGLALVNLGLYKLMSVRREFRYATFVSIGALLSILLALAMVGKNYLAFGMGAFVDIKAIFLRYLAELGILAIYYLTIKGFFQLMARSNVDRDFHKELTSLKKLILFTLITMVFIPFGQAFVGIYKIIICGVFLALNTVCKLMLLRKLKNVYEKMYVIKTDSIEEKKKEKKSVNKETKKADKKTEKKVDNKRKKKPSPRAKK